MFVYEISHEPLTDLRQSYTEDLFGPYWTSLNVKVKGPRSRSPGTKNALYTSITPRERQNGSFCCMTHCNALAANEI